MCPVVLHTPSEFNCSDKQRVCKKKKLYSEKQVFSVKKTTTKKQKGNAKVFRNSNAGIQLFFSVVVFLFFFLNASVICVEEVGTRFRSVTFLSLEGLCCVCCVHRPCAPHCVLCCRRCVRSALSFPRCHSAPWPPPLQR